MQLAQQVEIETPVGVRLHAVGDVAQQGLGEVDLDVQVGQAHLRRHAGALCSLRAEHHAVEQAVLEQREGSLAAPSAGMAAVSERNGAIGIRYK